MVNASASIAIQLVDEGHKEDINLRNDPFSLIGRFHPIYNGHQWHHQVSYFEQISEMCFPDGHYDFDELSSNGVIIGAYIGQKCVGLAILKHHGYKYMYLYDLNISKAYRQLNIGSMLMEKAKEIAKENHYNGVFTRAQDNNLSACLFYLKNGFVIGGIDTHVYKGTSQEGKIDILFYTE